MQEFKCIIIILIIIVLLLVLILLAKGTQFPRDLNITICVGTMSGWSSLNSMVINVPLKATTLKRWMQMESLWITKEGIITIILLLLFCIYPNKQQLSALAEKALVSGTDDDDEYWGHE